MTNRQACVVSVCCGFLQIGHQFSHRPPDVRASRSLVKAAYRSHRISARPSACAKRAERRPACWLANLLVDCLAGRPAGWPVIGVGSARDNQWQSPAEACTHTHIVAENNHAREVQQRRRPVSRPASSVSAVGGGAHVAARGGQLAGKQEGCRALEWRRRRGAFAPTRAPAPARPPAL